LPEWYKERVETKPRVEARSPGVPVVEEAKSKERIKVEFIKNVKNLQLLEEREAKFSLIDEMFVINLKQHSKPSADQWTSGDSKPSEDHPSADPKTPVDAKSSGRPMSDPKSSESPASNEDSTVRYHSDIIAKQLVEGNPFISILLDSVTIDDFSFITPTPKSKAFMKVWYYRDPQGEVRGAFDSIEMFNWYSAGYFTEELYVSYASRLQFVPLSCFIAHQKQIFSSMTYQSEPTSAETTKEFQSSNQHSIPWGSRETVPGTSLTDIQRQQAKMS
jgi:hypothetical protein